MAQLLLGNLQLYCLFNELAMVLDLLDCWGFFLQFFFFFLLANMGYFFLENLAKEKGLEF